MGPRLAVLLKSSWFLGYIALNLFLYYFLPIFKFFSITQWSIIIPEIGVMIQQKFKKKKDLNVMLLFFLIFIYFFSVWVFFHVHSQFTGQQAKGEAIYLTPLYHFHLLHRHYLDISWVITADSSPQHTASSQAWTKKLLFLSASC